MKLDGAALEAYRPRCGRRVASSYPTSRTRFNHARLPRLSGSRFPSAVRLAGDVGP